ncbi:MAG: succinate dehydrogenase cytochrome b subunit [Fuerstiella sp.]|nr:succinate dehydrogenase cytochrome b subunit [Fuerstiella sp.]
MDAVCRILSLPAVILSQIPGIGPVVKAVSTSVGQKVLMAVTGLLLCGFLVTHLAGNLLLYAGAEKFNHYAESLHSWGLLLNAAEVGLFSLFMAHIGLACSTTAMNRQARCRKYAQKESKQEPFALPGGGASGWMFVTGVMIGLFLIVHVTDMRLKKNPFIDYSPAYQNGPDAPPDEFVAVRLVLTNWTTLVYVMGLLALGIHLSHGFRSALQTLGINHPRWNPLLEIISLLFAWTITLGFFSLVIWAALTSGTSN